MFLSREETILKAEEMKRKIRLSKFMATLDKRLLVSSLIANKMEEEARIKLISIICDSKMFENIRDKLYFVAMVLFDYPFFQKGCYYSGSMISNISMFFFYKEKPLM